MAWCVRRVSVLLSVVSLLLTSASAATAAGFDQDPSSDLATVLVKKAKRAEKAGDNQQAYVYYSQASALEPRNRGYRARAAALKTYAGAAAVATVSQDSEKEAGAMALAPSAMFDSITARELMGERQLASPPRLTATSGRFDFALNETPHNLFEKVAARYDLQLVFDSEYPSGGQPVSFHVTQVDYRDALDALQAATGSFVIPLSPHVIMVAKDNPAKRNDLEQYVALTVAVPQVTTAQELNELVQVVRQATNVEKVGWDTANNQIIIRDRVSRASLAQQILSQLLAYRPEVMIDLELLQVSDSDLINYGLTVSSSFPLVYLGGIQNSLASIPSGVTNLVSFGGGRTLIGIAAAQIQAMFNESSSTGRALYSARLRAGNGQAGTFHVGEKYPIITSGYIGASSTNTSGSTSPNFAAPPAISWENLGLDLKATPRIHEDSEVSMVIEAAYEVLNGRSDDGIPEIETDKLSTTIRLRNDEWAVIAGLAGTSHSKSSSGVWGLARLPWIGNLFRQTSIDKQSSNLLIGIRPHITSLGADVNVSVPLRAGNDAHPYTPL